MNRATIGPKLVGFSPRIRNNVAGNSHDGGKLVLKTLTKDDMPHGGDSPKEFLDENKGIQKDFMERDDEDEVVEFETEETPKRGVFIVSS